jgi:uncharacterized protein YlaI
MLKTKCFSCRKEYEIDYKDSQYNKMKKNPKALYVCKNCNQSMQRESQSKTGLNPDLVDEQNKYL